MTKKTIVKNCATCWWSRRDDVTLKLYCYRYTQTHIITQEEKAHVCEQYSFKKPKNTQLDLFTENQ